MGKFTGPKDGKGDRGWRRQREKEHMKRGRGGEEGEVEGWGREGEGERECCLDYIREKPLGEKAAQLLGMKVQGQWWMIPSRD